MPHFQAALAVLATVNGRALLSHSNDRWQHDEHRIPPETEAPATTKKGRVGFASGLLPTRLWCTRAGKLTAMVSLKRVRFRHTRSNHCLCNISVKIRGVPRAPRDAAHNNKLCSPAVIPRHETRNTRTTRHRSSVGAREASGDREEAPVVRRGAVVLLLCTAPQRSARCFDGLLGQACLQTFACTWYGTSRCGDRRPPLPSLVAQHRESRDYAHFRA